MEPHVTSTCLQSVNGSTKFTENNHPPSPQVLAKIRSLVINPNTSSPTLLSILETLTRSLQLSRDWLSLHHNTLKLLIDLATHHKHLSPLIFDAIRSHSPLSSAAESPRLAAESLDALASVSEHLELDDQLFLSLCFGHSVPVRSWLLRNAERFRVRTSLLLTVYLGFTKDPYPLVRRDALDGLNRLRKSLDDVVLDDRELIEGCYRRAVELLRDYEDCVRQAAVRVVSEWGQMLVASNKDESRRDWSNGVFIQLCSMVRDMNVEVRREAFNALGNVGMVSENILLQTLSKKVLEISKDKKPHSQCTVEWFQIPASNAAGAFVHGLEDEFHEVRKSACNALRTLSILAAKFAAESLNLLMDMLNDDSVAVRSQALETMLHMATFKHLKLQEMHMHQFLGCLFDSEDFMRSTTKKVLKLVKLPNLKLYKLSVDALIKHLERYPQDEADAFAVLFCIGRNHGNFTVCTIKEAFHEIEPDTKGKLSFDSMRVAALLVLAISVPHSHNKSIHCISPAVFSYAVTLLGRLSCALSDVMNQNTLLAYLSQCCRSPSSSEIEFKAEQPFLPGVCGDVLKFSGTEIGSPVGMPLQRTGDEVSEVQSLTSQEQEKETLHAKLEEDDDVQKSISLILAQVKDVWPLVQSGCTSEVLRTLRACKEEVATFTSKALRSAGASAFTMQYLRVIKLLAKVWEHFVANRKVQFYEMGDLELLLGKLEKRLKELRCRFLGLSKEEELCVLELIVVTYLLRLSRVEIFCYLTTVKKLSAVISRVEFLFDQGAENSNFILEVRKQLHELGTSAGTYCRPFLFNKLLDFFSLKQFVLSKTLRHVSAELDVAGNNSENPLPFIPGLPVAIPLIITLHNIVHENRLWLRISMGEESTQFVFLDMNVLGGCNEVRRFTFNAPFYRTPKAVSFALRICIIMECLFEDVCLAKGHKDPKNDLVHLCQGKEVYLSMVRKD